MDYHSKLPGLLTAAVLAAAVTAGCSSSKGSSSTTEPTTVSGAVSTDVNTTAEDIVPVTAAAKREPVEKPSPEEIFSDRDLDPSYESLSAEITLGGSSASVDGTGADANGGTVTVTAGGIYRVSGKLDNGQIIVDAQKEKVQLVLDNADITCKTSSPILVNDSDKVFITLAEGSMNTLTDGRKAPAMGEDEPDAAVFSRDSLTINGKGSLKVKSDFGCGLRSKDDIVLTGGTLDITSGDDGIKAKDYFAAAGGTVNIITGGDGIKATNAEETALGFVYVKDGAFTIDSRGDGIQAESVFTAEGGDFDITTAGGNDLSDGHRNIDGDDDAAKSFLKKKRSQVSFDTEAPKSRKGIKAGAELYIGGGSFTVDSADDGLHSNDSLFITGAEDLAISAADDGIHADNNITVSGGSVNIVNAFEGMESAVIDICGGDIKMYTNDDGLNAGKGTGGRENREEGVCIAISGGSLYVDSWCDGIDSNGDIIITGGDTTVDGPENGMNGAVDCNGGFVVSGGSLIAAGYHDMADYPSGSSTQYVLSIGFDNILGAGVPFNLKEDGGDEFRYVPKKSYDHILMTSPMIEKGRTYTAYTGDNETEGCSFTFTVSDMVTKQGQQTYMDQFR